MASLLERLENWQTVYPEDQDKPEGHLYLEAAKHIRDNPMYTRADLEKVLEALVKDVEDYWGHVSSSPLRYAIRTLDIDKILGRK